MNKKGFLLVEIITAITFLSFTFAFILNLSTEIKKSFSEIENKKISIYLAEEGIKFFKIFKKIEEKEGKYENFLSKIELKDEKKSEIFLKITKKKGKIFEINKIKALKNIEIIDDLCEDLENFENCKIETVKITSKDEDYKKVFFRVLKIKKLRKNLLEIQSIIFWEKKGKLLNFSLKNKIGNVEK